MKKPFLLSFIIIIMCSLTKAQWSSDPMDNLAISNASGEQAIPKLATAENGTTYISWYSNESGNYNVRLQKLDIFGNKQWAEEGLLVSNHPAMSWLTDWDMTVDHEDCSILTFQDIRNTDNDVFAYRISPEGEFLWGEDGIEMSTGPAFDASPKVCVTNANNAVFAWQADEVVLLQKISPDGVKLWGENGITLSTANTYSWPQVLPVGNDDVILKYFEDSGPIWAPTRHVFAQRYDPDGNPVWTSPSVISNAGGISAWTQVFSFIPDGYDGFYIAWHDDRDQNNLSSAFVQHVDANGQILLGDDGTEATTMLNRNHFYPHLALPVGSDEIYVYWNEMDADQNNRGIYGQKISSLGERMWTDNGKALVELSSTNVYPFAASQSSTNTMVFYEQYFDGLNAGIHAMQIDVDGQFVWEEETIALCSVQSEKIHAVAGHLFYDQWISVWEDKRNGAADIYGQNIQLDGTLGALPAELQIEITPDTLFIEENAMIYYIYVKNVAYADYIVDTVFAYSQYWFLDYWLPDFPYTILHNDTLTILIDVFYTGWGGSGTGYVYDTVFVESSIETKTSIVAFNMEVIPGIHQKEEKAITVYPNPSEGTVHFKFDKMNIDYGQLIILNHLGRVVKKIDLSGESIISWNGCDQQNNKVPPGVYIYQVNSNVGSISGKIILR